MKSSWFPQRVPFTIAILLLVGASGCDEEFLNWSHGNRARFERTISQRIAPGERDTLDVATRFGSVAVTGADVTDCNVVATIVAQASTEEEAQELAEQVEIVGEAAGSTLRIRSHEPDLPNHRSISVSYTITVPRRMNVTCDSSYGRLNVSGIEGRLAGKSSNGSIKARDIQGETNLDTSYGSIECRDVTGASIRLHSNNGSITAAGLRGLLTAESDYGSLTCEDFSDGDLRLKSGNGRIRISDASFGVCEARSSYGAVAGRDLKGDSIKLHSSNGGIDADDVQAKEIDLSSSYGTIRATEVAASSLKATSGNGGVHIACSPAAPADLHAEVRSSYGRVEFDAPEDFAGEVYLSTDYGTIRSARPITMTGEITKKRIIGTIGTGIGQLRLESGNGSVELK